MAWIEVHPAGPENEHTLATLENAAWALERRAEPRRGADEPSSVRTAGRRTCWSPSRSRTACSSVTSTLLPQFTVPSNAHVIRLLGLLVSPAARNQRIGAKLLAAGIEEARVRGARKVEVRALATNATAIDLYTREGFVEEARFQDEFALDDGELVDDVWFCRWIG